LVLGLATLTVAPAPASSAGLSLSTLAAGQTATFADHTQMTTSLGDVAGAGTAALRPTWSATATATRVWIVPAYWNTPPGAAYRANLTAMAAQAAQFYDEESLGRTHLTLVGVRPNIKIAHYSSCRTTKAQEAARASVGPRYRPGDVIVTAVPPKSDCQFGGHTLGNDVWLAEWATPGPLAHELGHVLFDFGHDGRLDCTTGTTFVTFGQTCTSDEYGNPYSVMGAVAPLTRPVDGRTVIGGLSATDLAASRLRPLRLNQLVASSEILRLSARAATTGPTSLVVPWYHDTAYGVVSLWLEYRVAQGADFWIDSVKDNAGLATPGSGVLVTTGATPYTNPSGTDYGGGLLNMHPETLNGGGGYSPAMRAGDTFTTPNGAVTVTVLDASAEHATVRIDRNIPDTGQPLMDLYHPRAHRVTHGYRVQLSWDAEDDVALRSTTVTVDRRLPVTFYNRSPLFVGAASSGSLRIRLSRGTHRVSVTAHDYAGNARTATRTLTLR
jgi:hypothetical protein